MVSSLYLSYFTSQQSTFFTWFLRNYTLLSHYLFHLSSFTGSSSSSQIVNIGVLQGLILFNLLSSTYIIPKPMTWNTVLMLSIVLDSLELQTHVHVATEFSSWISNGSGLIGTTQISSKWCHHSLRTKTWDHSHPMSVSPVGFIFINKSLVCLLLITSVVPSCI